jgi:hypothetical protein
MLELVLLEHLPVEPNAEHRVIWPADHAGEVDGVILPRWRTGLAGERVAPVSTQSASSGPGTMSPYSPDGVSSEQTDAHADRRQLAPC